MQMVINLAPVSLSNKKVNFYTCPRLTFLKKIATENAYKSISEPLDFKIFWGGGMPQDPPSSPRLWRSKLASSCTEVWLQPYWDMLVVDWETTNSWPFTALNNGLLKRSHVIVFWVVILQWWKKIPQQRNLCLFLTVCNWLTLYLYHV